MSEIKKFKDETITLLTNRSVKLTFGIIAKDLHMSVAWLSKLSRGEIKNPGIDNIEKLNEYLKNYKPE